MYRQALIWEASAVLRHALRNKLASLRNATTYLQRRIDRDAPTLGASDKNVPTFFELIDKELVAADVLLSMQIPGLASPAMLDTFEIEPLVDDALAEVAVPDRITVVRGARTQIPATTAYELAVAIVCLVENAVEAIADRGTITINCRIDGSNAVIEVIDDGSGMDPAIAARALEPEITSKRGRSGLGLSIARRMAVRSRGSLRVIDQRIEGKTGVRATLSVPLATGS